MKQPVQYFVVSPLAAITFWILVGMELLSFLKHSWQMLVVHRILISLLSLGTATPLLLHKTPSIFDGIQVRTVSRPVHDLERLLFQKQLDPFGGMAWSPILEEVGGSMNPH